MDRKIEDKRWIKPKHWKYIAGVIFILVVALAFVFRDPMSTYRADLEKITVETVKYDSFQDYIRIVGFVEPISTIYMDAIEGGIVEEILIEEGTFVHKGDVIIQLSNNRLNLDILNSEASLAEKSNFLRETQINMEQQKLLLQRDLINQEYDLIQKERAYNQNKSLYEEELIAREDFLQSKESYEMAMKLRELTLKRNVQDSIYRKNQITKISLNLENMEKNLELIYQRKENLNIKAPVDGQLGFLDAELGQSIASGQRIGQVNVLTSYKIKAQIDEHYIDRIRRELAATFERQSDTFNLKVNKVYPEVRNGKFDIDLVFTDKQPDNIRTGQSYQISLQLGVTMEAVLIDRGGFFQSTGGQWVYVLSPDETFATKRSIRIGRQNPRYYEVLEGLEPGEKVVTSSYEAFGDNEKLVF